MEHKHIYDAEGNQLCCTQEEKIYLNVGVKHNEFFHHNQIL
jgi:Cd2+/Zn2+-exporting ATPase